MNFPIQDAKDLGRVLFHYQDENFLAVPKQTEAWIKQLVEEEGQKLTRLIYIFCDDEYLLDLNQKHLQHDTLTDIITFPMSEKKVDAEMYISFPRVKENAEQFDSTLEKELMRVVFHGVLHLCGYSDKDDESKAVMRAKEDFYLQQHGF